MKNLKIDSLKIKNFKSITEALFKFDENNLIIFDGPNGYGKTTAFEAIEIIFSKTPRRYRAIALDKRSSFINSPIHKNEELSIELCLCLKNKKESIQIKRCFGKAVQKKSIDNHIKNIFDSSQLYIDERIAQEEDLEVVLGFENIEMLFNVLNYVEQDENTFFLKKDPKDRYRELSSLLGAERELFQLEKIKNFDKKLSDLIKQKSNEKESIIKKNEEILKSCTTDILYKKLIAEKDFPWDQENIINTDIDIRNSYLFEVEKIKNLFSIKKSLKDIHFIFNIQKYINDDFIDNFIEYYWKIENYENLKNEIDNRKRNEALIKINNEIIESIEAFNYEYLNKEKTLLYLKNKKINIDIEILAVKLRSLLTQKEALGVQAKILNNLKNKRTELILIQTQHKNLINLTDSECPTCGFDWDSSDNLLTHINNTELKIFKEYNNSNEEFEQLKREINSILSIVKTLLLTENTDITIKTKEFINQDDFLQLNEIYSQSKQKIESFLELMKKDDQISIISLVNHKEIKEKKEIKFKIRDIIENRKPNIDLNLNIQQIITDFDLYFNNSIEQLNSLSLEEINNKSLYITFQYYLSINKDLSILNHKIEQFKTFKTEIEYIKDTLDKGIKEYTKNIVDTVTIPFYIFTGKILQHHSLGSGLVLDLDVAKKDPQLKINPAGRDQEVSYTLSSGQLSATVISLMLVLNKVYNKSKLGMILIDDPLQTLDEINAHSLIEVLKYNFSEKQVVLSTHEDRYSKLIRYKYDKFNLLNKNIKMKDIF